MPARKHKANSQKTGTKWSGRVTRESSALDLEQGVFKARDPKKIAASLKRSAEHSRRRRAGAYQSAMSMLNFYINRAGKGLPQRQKRVLEHAKASLRALFGKTTKTTKKNKTGKKKKSN